MLRILTLVSLALMSDTLAALADASPQQSEARAATTFRAAASRSIAITRDDKFVWAVNRDNNSVSVLGVDKDENKKKTEIPVGIEPRCVAITPDDKKVFVTNMVSGTVSVIDATVRKVIATIPVGTEPFGCAVTPDGKKLYVTNFASNDVSVIDVKLNQVVKTIPSVGTKPRGIAITADSKKVYVTRFLAQLRDGKVPAVQLEGRDDGKVGSIVVISTVADAVVGQVVLNPLADTGFKSDGSTLDKITVPPAQLASFTTGAFPNLLQGIAIQGNRGYLPNTASSPNGPFKFNVNVQAFLSVFDTVRDVDSKQTINMNKGVQFEPPGQRLFLTNPIDIAFEGNGKEGWVVSAATDRIIKVLLDANGMPTINAPAAALPAGQLSNVVRVAVGKNPTGIVLNSTGTRAYVLNFISRDVSAVDIAAATPFEKARISSALLPTAGSLAQKILQGHELFNTSIGPAGTQAFSKPPAGRMSNFGWGSCYSCHPDGLHDGVTWMFPDGPRQSISMESTFAHPQPLGTKLNASGAPLAPFSDQRVLNWSAVREEVQDFDLNIRAVSGGEGLIDAPVTDVFNLVPTANTGRSADLDTLATYVAFGIRAPISPLRNVLLLQGKIQQGRALFNQANCQFCHGGEKWTRSRVDFQPPPLAPPNKFAEVIIGGQLVRFLEGVGTFDFAAPNEFKAQAGTQTANTVANGELGFNIPSLVSADAGAPYLHSGSARTLDEVVENVQHRTAGTGVVDTLVDPAARANLVLFLRSIDEKTTIFP